MPGYISEINYDGNANQDFIEVALPPGTNSSGWSIVFYDEDGTVKTTFSLGPSSGTIGGQDLYLIDRNDAGFTDLGATKGYALVDSSGTVQQFISFSSTITAVNGPAAGQTAQQMGDQTTSGETMETTDGGATYQTQTAPNPDQILTQTGTAGDDLLVGGTGNDTLYGMAGNDTLVGGAGADRLDGGTGIDLSDYSNSSAGVTVNLATGTGTGGHAQGDTLIGIENLTGSSFNDSLTGDGNANVLSGGAGNDTLRGAGGDDTLIGGAGADSLDGGTGLDTADYSASGAGVTVNLVTGTGTGGHAQGDTLTGIENLTGSAFNDSLTGDANANVLSGGAGNDTLLGGDGNDTLIGGAGADSLSGGTGTDTADYSTSGAGVTVNLATGTGTGGDAQGDTLTGVENLTGSAFNDSLTGDGNANVLSGGSGNDTLVGGAGSDTLSGGIGEDYLDGGDNDDSISGGDGNDTILGGSGRDTILGGDGADVIDGGANSDTIYGGAGNDLITDTGGGTSDDTIYGGAGNDTISGGDREDLLDGGIGDDSISGDDGDDTIIGGDGSDTLIGGAGADSLSGGTGTDTADYSASGAGVTVNLVTGTGTGGDAQGDTLTGVENLTGSAFNDSLTGDANANVLSGGAGNDTLSGGEGNDTFTYSAGSGSDTITDFNFGNTGSISDGNGSNNDFIDLSAFYDDIWELHADQADDGILNQSNNGFDGADYSDNAQFGSGSLTFSGASADNTSFTSENTSVVCYAPGTLIDTPDGPRAVETLRPGDLVLTLDHGAQAIRWTRSGDHPLEDAEVEAKPVQIKAGALGHNLPTHDLIVSSQHRFLVGGGGQLQQVFATEAFAPAKSLTGAPGIRHMKGKKEITWIHFACDRHEVVTANGCLSESLLLGPMVVNGLSPAERQTVTDLFGPAPTPDAALNGPPARECLSVGAVKRRIAKHLKEKGKIVAKESKKWDVDAAMEKYEAERMREALTMARAS